MEIQYDLDGFVWVRTDSELAGPYDSEDEARADFADPCGFAQAVNEDAIDALTNEQVDQVLAILSGI